MKAKKRAAAILVIVLLLVVQFTSVGTAGQVNASETKIYDSYAMSNLNAKGNNLPNSNKQDRIRPMRSIKKLTANLQISCTGTNDVQAGTPSIHMSIKGSINTSIKIDKGGQKTLAGFPVDANKSYSATVTVPAGYSIEHITVNSTRIGSGPTFNFKVTSTGGANIDVQLKKNNDNAFHSKDAVKNRLQASEWNTIPQLQQLTVNIEGKVIPEEPKPFDIVLLLDLSNSMTWGLDASGDVPIGQRRVDYLKKSVNKLLDTLTEAPPEGSKLSIVSFGTKSKVELDWVDLMNLKNSANAKKAVVDQINALKTNEGQAGGTMIDLGFARVRKQFDARLSTANDRHVVFFSDGMAGTYDLRPYADSEMPGTAEKFYSKSIAAIYSRNNFRVMAEALNQANVLKGVRGSTVTTNEKVAGYGATRGSWIDYYGFACTDDVTYLQGDWERFNDYSPDDADANPIKVDDPKNFQSGKGGNFNRTATGYGATVTAVGIFDSGNYEGETPGIINKNMNAIVTQPKGGEQNFFDVKNDDQLNVAFQILTGRISGIYKDAVVRYYYDSSKYKVIDAAGGSIKQDEKGKTCLSWSGFDINPAQPFRKAVKLEPVDVKYNGAAPGSEVLFGVLVNGSVKEISKEFISRRVWW